MTQKDKEVKTQQRVEAVEETLTKAEQFIEKNQKILLIILCVIVGIIAIYLGYKKLYLAPLEKEAQTQMFMAERYFENDSLDLAINGDGVYPGFVDIIDEYGSTKCGNLSKYYLGVIYMKKGEYESALEYLKKFNKRDEILGTTALGLIGDAYFQLGEKQEALSFYEKACVRKPNKFLTPIYLLRTGRLCEDLGQYEKAAQMYLKIINDYKDSREGRDAEKLYAKVSALLNK